MILTFLHVAISLIAIATGFVVLFGLLTGRRLDRMSAWFLATTVATSVTGFGFPLRPFLPSHVVGIISLVLLTVAIYARYGRDLAGAWRPAYVVTAVVSLYLNVFVLIIQSFLKVPALHALAPTQSEPAFVGAQLTALVAFLLAGAVAVVRFRPIVDYPTKGSYSPRRSFVA